MNHNQGEKTIAVGIPTYEAGDSLVVTLQSLYSQTYFEHISEVVVVVDGKEISEHILKQISNSKLRVIQHHQRKGQSVGINSILENSNTDLVVLTNDDVILEANAVEKLSQTFFSNELDLIAANVKPLPGKNFLQRVLEIGYLINHEQILVRRENDNYLFCNGRLIGLSNKLAKSMKLPEKLLNSDAFVYLFAKLNSFKFRYEDQAICYFQNPSILGEHLKQSAKFQNSLQENKFYLKTYIAPYYTTPMSVKVIAFYKTFFRYPLRTLFFTLLFIYGRLATDGKGVISQLGYWPTDKTTKVLN